MNTESRDSNEVEAVLFDDELIGPDGGYDVEQGRNRIVDIQERMTKGMKFINKITKRIDEAKGGAYLHRKQFMYLVDERKRCWALWFRLKELTQAIASEHPALWPEYFKLAKEELTPYYCTSDAEAIDNINKPITDKDNPSNLLLVFNERLDCEAEAHVQEMEQYKQEFNENPYLPRDCWDTRYERKLINNQLEFDSMVDMMKYTEF